MKFLKICPISQKTARVGKIHRNFTAIYRLLVYGYNGLYTGMHTVRDRGLAKEREEWKGNEKHTEMCLFQKTANFTKCFMAIKS